MTNRPAQRSTSVIIAYEILKRRRRPMTPKELIEVATRDYGLRMRGKTPDATLNSNFINERKRRERAGLPQRFVRVAPGTWGLVEYFDKLYGVRKSPQSRSRRKERT